MYILACACGSFGFGSPIDILHYLQSLLFRTIPLWPFL
jgi:hypothetical protein